LSGTNEKFPNRSSVKFPSKSFLIRTIS
jgi:hypothetical protein